MLALMHFNRLVDEVGTNHAPAFEFQQVVIGHLAQGLVGLHPHAERQAKSLLGLFDRLPRQPTG